MRSLQIMEINFTFWKLEVQNGEVSSAVGLLKARGEILALPASCGIGSPLEQHNSGFCLSLHGCPRDIIRTFVVFVIGFRAHLDNSG